MNSTYKHRASGLTVEAMQAQAVLDAVDLGALPEWVGDAFGNGYIGFLQVMNQGRCVVVKIANRRIEARGGQYIVASADGDSFMVYEKDEFEQIYEPLAVDPVPAAPVSPKAERWGALIESTQKTAEQQRLINIVANMPNPSPSPLIAMLDVESVGVHGEGFAVAIVVGNLVGHVLRTSCYHCTHHVAHGSLESHAWVDENVTIPDFSVWCPSPFHVRAAFWDEYMLLREAGVEFWADVACPVETNFFRDCIEDDEERGKANPYPLLDVATALRARYLPPVGTYERLSDELPAHNPVNDARQSLRVLCDVMNNRVPKLAT